MVLASTFSFYKRLLHKKVCVIICLDMRSQMAIHHPKNWSFSESMYYFSWKDSDIIYTASKVSVFGVILVRILNSVKTKISLSYEKLANTIGGWLVDHGLVDSPNKKSGVNHLNIFGALKSPCTYQAKLSLGMGSKELLLWWIKNLALDNMWSLIHRSRHVLIILHPSNEGRGATY